MFQHSHFQLFERNLKILKPLYKQENNIPLPNNSRRLRNKPRRL